VFWSNTSVFAVCVCLIFELISAGTNTWYIQHNDYIKYRHGGLWDECMGEIARTFCTPMQHIPVWLHVSRVCIVVAVGVTFISLLYMMVAMARRKLSLSVMIAFNNAKCIIFVVGMLVFTVKGFPSNFTPGTSFYLGWVTCVVQIMTSLLWFYSYVQVGKLTRLQVHQAGLTS